MSADDELTILLTLKDRPLYTLRWMSYANSINFPFKVLIADGGADKTVAKALSNKAKYPNVSYEYIRYPYDETYADYYSKVVDALSQVKTPFVAMADNDDFFLVEGLRSAVDFLRVHLDYSSCGGQFGVFWLTSSNKDRDDNGVYGNHIEYKWYGYHQSLTEETAVQRIQSRQFDSAVTFYDVQRTEELKVRFEKVCRFDIKNLFLVEYLLAFLIGIEGKTQRSDRLYLMRQWNTLDTSAGMHGEKFGDILDQMFDESWSDDFAKFMNVVAAALAEKDGLSLESSRDQVKKSYRTFIAPSIVEILLEEPNIPLLMPLIVQIVQYLIRRGAHSIATNLFHNLYRRASWIPVNAVNGLAFLIRPSSTYRADFKPIADFLMQKSRGLDF